MTEPNWAYWGHTGIGATIMALLMLARHRFVWWPLHPIGYGGPRLYRSLRPLFFGFIIGEWGPKMVIVAIEIVRQS